MTTVRIFTATKLSQIASHGAVCDPSRVVQLFPARSRYCVRPSYRDFASSFAIESVQGAV